MTKQEASGLISGRSFRDAQACLSPRSPAPTVTELYDLLKAESRPYQFTVATISALIFQHRLLCCRWRKISIDTDGPNWGTKQTESRVAGNVTEGGFYHTVYSQRFWSNWVWNRDGAVSTPTKWNSHCPIYKLYYAIYNKTSPRGSYDVSAS